MIVSHLAATENDGHVVCSRGVKLVADRSIHDLPPVQVFQKREVASAGSPVALIERSSPMANG